MGQKGRITGKYGNTRCNRIVDWIDMIGDEQVEAMTGMDECEEMR